MGTPFIQGYTRRCCICLSIATNWSGWLRKSRDGIVAGFCDEHKMPPNVKNTYGGHNLRGIYNKEMEEVLKKPSIKQLEMVRKNIIEQ